MKTLFNFLLLASIATFTSCKTPRVEVLTAPTKYDEISIFSIEKNMAQKVVLFVPDDDTVSIEQQINFLLPLLDKKTSLFAFPKYKYTNIIEKDNADNPSFRLELLVAAYQELIDGEKILETQEVIVLGLGEGALIAPHFSRLINAKQLLLINPLYHSYKENITIAYTEKTKNAQDLKTYIGFAYQKEWLDFFDDVNNKNMPDKSAGKRTYRYYSSYWNYYPGQFIGTQMPTKILIFKDYYLSSQFDKNFMLNINQPNISAVQIEGYMFSKFSLAELKKLDWF